MMDVNKELARLLASSRKEDREKAVRILETARERLLREMDEETLRELKVKSQRNLQEAREELAAAKRELGPDLLDSQVELLKHQEQLSLEEIAALDGELRRRKPH